MSVTPLGVFKETAGQFQAVVEGPKKLCFWQDLGTSAAFFFCWRARSLLTLTKWFWRLNLTRSQAQLCYKNNNSQHLFWRSCCHICVFFQLSLSTASQIKIIFCLQIGRLQRVVQHVPLINTRAISQTPYPRLFTALMWTHVEHTHSTIRGPRHRSAQRGVNLCTSMIGNMTIQWWVLINHGYVHGNVISPLAIMLMKWPRGEVFWGTLIFIIESGSVLALRPDGKQILLVILAKPAACVTCCLDINLWQVKWESVYLHGENCIYIGVWYNKDK